jgi:hypothetical protein
MHLKGLTTILAISLLGCGVSSPIKKATESESEFSSDPLKTIKPIKGNPELWRIYDRAASGFVSIGATREGLEERARKFCEDKNKGLNVVASEQSNPPYILGNFPRMELIFVCTEKSNSNKNNSSDDQYSKLTDLKKLLDNGTLTQSEFDEQKRKVLYP